MFLLNSFPRSKTGITPLEKKATDFRKNSLTGLTFLEVIITLTLYTVAFLSLSQLFNVSLNANKKVNQGVIATHLAQGFMAEIMAKDFVDPTDPATTLGVNAGETNTSRSTFDDVDDYDVYPDETPPKTLGGIVMNGTNNTPNYSDFTRGVDVYYCVDNGTGSIISTGNGGTDSPYTWKCVNVTVTAPSMKTVTFVELKVQ